MTWYEALSNEGVQPNKLRRDFEINTVAVNVGQQNLSKETQRSKNVTVLQHTATDGDNSKAVEAYYRELILRAAKGMVDVASLSNNAESETRLRTSRNSWQEQYAIVASIVFNLKNPRTMQSYATFWHMLHMNAHENVN